MAATATGIVAGMRVRIARRSAAIYTDEAVWDFGVVVSADDPRAWSGVGRRSQRNRERIALREVPVVWDEQDYASWMPREHLSEIGR